MFSSWFCFSNPSSSVLHLLLFLLPKRKRVAQFRAVIWPHEISLVGTTMKCLGAMVTWHLEFVEFWFKGRERQETQYVLHESYLFLFLELKKCFQCWWTWTFLFRWSTAMVLSYAATGQLFLLFHRPSIVNLLHVGRVLGNIRFTLTVSYHHGICCHHLPPSLSSLCPSYQIW